jgi:hypothetical protein
VVADQPLEFFGHRLRFLCVFGREEPGSHRGNLVLRVLHNKLPQVEWTVAFARAEVNKENYVGRTAVQRFSRAPSVRLARNDLIPTSSTSLGEAPSQKARRGWLIAV